MKIYPKRNYNITQTLAEKISAAKKMGIKIPESKLDSFELKDIKLKKLAQECLELTDENFGEKYPSIMENFNLQKNEAYENNHFQGFSDKLEVFATELADTDCKAKKQMAGALFLHLGTKNFASKAKAESLFKYSIAQHLEANDPISAITTMQNLSKLYEETRNKRELYALNKKMLTTLDSIIEDLPKAKQNCTIPENKMRSVKIPSLIKAAVCNQLAGMTAHAKNDTPKKYVLMAMDIYKKYEMRQELEFAKKQLDRIKHSKMINKLRKYDPRERREIKKNKLYNANWLPTETSNNNTKLKLLAKQMVNTQAQLKRFDQDYFTATYEKKV